MGKEGMEAGWTGNWGVLNRTKQSGVEKNQEKRTNEGGCEQENKKAK